MISPPTFRDMMALISDRTASVPKDETLAMYYGFLSARLNDEEFTKAAMALFASAEFFPAPIKFLEARIGTEWDKVASLLDEYTPPTVRAGWAKDWGELAPETKKAISRLGGPLAFKDKLYAKDPPRAYRQFVETYQVALQDLAAEDVQLQSGEKKMIAP